MALDILVIIVICTVGIICASVYKRVSLGKAEEMQMLSAEIAKADLESLTVSSVPGSEVLSAIRKYKKDMSVYVKTVQSLDTEEYKSDSVLDNTDQTDPNYIMPDALFTCSLYENLNGEIDSITFTQNPTIGVSNDSELTIGQVKDSLVAALGTESLITNRSSFQSICEEIEKLCGAEEKILLCNELGMPVTTLWSEIAAKLVAERQSLQAQLNDAKAQASSTQKAQGSLAQGGEISFSFVPSIIVVYYNDGSAHTATLLSNQWYYDTTTADLFHTQATAEGIKLKNNSNHNATYYVYK